MAGATVRIRPQTQEVLRSLAREMKEPMAEILARAVEVYQQQRLLEGTNAADAGLGPVPREPPWAQQLAECSRALEAAKRELDSFTYTISHDLRAPLRAINGFGEALLEEYAGQLDETGQDYLRRIRAASQRLAQLIDALLGLSRVMRAEMQPGQVDLSDLARKIATQLHQTEPERPVSFVIADGVVAAQGDPNLLEDVLQKLLDNAWKFTRKHPTAHIEFGTTEHDGQPVYYVRDDGAGFDMAYADKLFGVFQRLHGATEFEGLGVELAQVERIIRRHGGRVWAEAALEQGATFYFTLPSAGGSKVASPHPNPLPKGKGAELRASPSGRGSAGPTARRGPAR